MGEWHQEGRREKKGTVDGKERSSERKTIDYHRLPSTTIDYHRLPSTTTPLYQTVYTCSICNSYCHSKVGLWVTVDIVVRDIGCTVHWLYGTLVATQGAAASFFEIDGCR